MNNEQLINRTVALCEQAVKEKNDGNVTLMNKIGGHGGLQTFFANAFSIHSVQYNQFARLFPLQWKEIASFWEAVEQEELAEAASAQQTESIEARLSKLEETIMAFIESQTKPVVEDKPAKKAKKPAKVEEPVAEQAEEAADGAVDESEA